ncbi:flagellar motor protein [Paenibacillus hemerocallicola]|uniref:Flagellar motor protein n=1 Tax=Paenibacillus hemerocallicola TaxID=1172614 RepID=A0A5C4T308_9BACL|nr:flagellar motor protein MotB [Paenibacillus hemerocallicola]TNJ63413.1 flagellar motor protein [Paenibacillus hemerocallicola]
MARRRKRQASSHSSSERWLITYADLITLLMIFFVIMYAMSKVDIAKYETLSKALQVQFNDGPSIIPKGTGIMGDAIPGEAPAGEDQQKDAPPVQTASTDLEQKEQNLQNLLKVVQQYIAEQHLEGQVSASDTSRGIAITLNDLFLFDLGKADLKQGAYPVLEKLASLFPKLNAKVSIEGHTDDLPLAAGSLFQDNWGLSQARSVSVIRYFVNSANLQPGTFISSAYADTKPVSPNDSDTNRQKNRRVEIVVLRGDTNGN